jgi:hypothetical protein
MFRLAGFEAWMLKRVQHDDGEFQSQIETDKMLTKPCTIAYTATMIAFLAFAVPSHVQHKLHIETDWPPRLNPRNCS